MFWKGSGTGVTISGMSSIYPNLVSGAFVGNYRLAEQIGAGGMGIVFRAFAPDGKAVAVKVLRPELADNPTVRERLRREAGALRRVTGGRTAQVFEVDADHNPPYLVMELVSGAPLDVHISENGPLSGLMLKSFAEGICEAVRDIHAAGIVHRDLKPSNVIIGPDGVKVLDFGVSVLQEAVTLTKTGVFVGTTSWLSPEQVQGHSVDAASDVFNLGLLIVYAATGVHAFGEGRPDAVMYRVVHDEPNLGSLTGSVRDVASSCLQKSPVLRPSVASVSALLTTRSDSPASIGSSTTATRIVAEPSTQNGNSLPPLSVTVPQRSKVPIGAAFALVAALAIGAGVVISQRGSDSDSPSLSPAEAQSVPAEGTENTDVPEVDRREEISELFESDFDSVFQDILESDYQVPGLTILGDSRDNAMSVAWGVQLDCDGFYPVRAALPFWRTAKPVFSTSYSNYIEGADYPNKYISSQIGITVFYQPGEFDDFEGDAETLTSAFESCRDEDFYLPFEDEPDIAGCVSLLFPAAGWTDIVIDDVCARRINQRVSWDTDATTDKYAYVTPEPVHGRKGFAISFGANPVESEDKAWGARANQSIHVWLDEGIAVVVTSYGGNANGDFPNDDDAIENRIFDYRFAAEDAANEFITRLFK
jgi:serine/threonine protein kinase